MSGLRAYALGVAELHSLVAGPPAQQERLRALVRQAFAPPRPRLRDALGPIYRRVPGAPVLRDDDPTAADLEALLSGTPVPRARAAATWRLVEAAVTGLAWDSVRLPDVVPPAGLLAPLDLPVPPAPGLLVGWSTVEQARPVRGLGAWVTGAEGWTAAAVREGRPAPDVVVFAGT